MSWKQQRKKHPKGFTVIVDEDSAVMPPKNRNFANPMITFRTHSNPDPSITINMPRKWKFHGNVPQRPRDVSISFDKRIEFGQAGPSTEKIVIENDAQVAEQKPRNRLFEALGVKKPIVVNTDLIGPAFVSKISFSNPFFVAKQGDEPKKKQAKEVLTEARIKRSAINPILPPGVDKPVAQKRAEPVVIPTVRTPAAEPTLTVIRPPAKLAKESSQQPSATVDTTTSPDTTKTEEMLRIFPKKQTYDPEKMTTSDKEKMQKEIFATRKRKFEQNSQMNPTVLPPHLLQPIKRKTIETPSARGKSEEKSYRRIEASLKGPRKEEEEKQTINVLKIKPKVSPLEKLPNDHRTSSVREHKADEHDFDQRKQDEGWNKTVQKMKSLRKSVEKERNSLHHNFEHSRDLRKSEVYISHARQIDHRRRMDSRNRTTVSSQRLPENGPILSGNKVVCEVGSKKEDTYSSHHRSHQSKQAGDFKRAPSPLVTLTVKETTVIRPETEHDTNRRDHRSSHHRRHDNNKKESQSEKVYSATATSLENDSISMRQVTEDDIKRKGRPSSSQRKASSSKSQDERKQNPSPETTGKENGSISIRQVTENDSSHIDKHSSHPRRHENSKEKDASECRESVVLRTKERESTWIEPKKERDRESRKRHRNTSLQRDRDHCKKMREDDRKVPSNRLGKKPWSERDQSRKHEKRGGRDSKEDWSKKQEYKSEFETPKVLDSTNDRDRIIPFFTNKYVFSNHFPCPGLKINEKNFCCIEQYYMWRKAKFSKNEAAAAAILMSTDAKQMKLIGSSLDKFDARSWKKVSWKYMLEANLQKYEQFEKLRFELFRTIGGVLVEASPKDNWWGVGLDLDSEDLKDWRKWKGKNLLGELLMEIRDRLSREYKYKEEVRRARRCLLVNAQ